MTPPLKRASIAGASILVGTLLLSPAASLADPDSPGNDKPTISEVEQRIEKLSHEAEIASERFNTVRVELTAAHKRLEALNADVRRQRRSVEALRTEVVSNAVNDYQSAAGLSTTTSFLVANDPAKFMESLATDAVVEHQQAGLLTTLIQEQRQLGVQEKQAQTELDAIADHKAELADQRAELADKKAQAEDILADLKEKQRQRLLRLQQQQAEAAAADTATSRSEPRIGLNDAPASGDAATAVQTALAQVGDSYVWGATGPDSFDCSGLTMYAWAAAGVSLPHSSSMQVSAGTPVSTSELQPGDLVFYYSPISHVGMYIGNGQIVHASNPSSPVGVAPVDSMPIAAATRVG